MGKDRPGLAVRLWRGRGVLIALAIAQLRARHAGSVLGVAWALVQPAAVMAVFWFVFSFGLRLGEAESGVPFVPRLLVGLCAWFFFHDAVSAAVHAVTGSAHLVKKVAFPLEVLPLAPVLAALVIHLGVLGCVTLALAVAGLLPGAAMLMLPIYLLGLSLLAAGMGYWLAALHVFQRDVAHITTLMLQLWFWLSPVVWSFSAFPDAVAAALRLNPLVWPIEGYRFSLLAEHPPPALAEAALFWVFAGLLLVSGLALYQRLRPDFADVL